MSLLEHYRYGGARALVLLHDLHLRSYLVIWQQANAAGVTLPETNNSNYASLETLHHHVLASARGYMNWICENLQLPDPHNAFERYILRLGALSAPLILCSSTLSCIQFDTSSN